MTPCALLHTPTPPHPHTPTPTPLRTPMRPYTPLSAYTPQHAFARPCTLLHVPTHAYTHRHTPDCPLPLTPQREDTGGNEVVGIQSQMSPPAQRCIRVSLTKAQTTHQHTHTPAHNLFLGLATKVAYRWV